MCAETRTGTTKSIDHHTVKSFEAQSPVIVAHDVKERVDVEHAAVRFAVVQVM